MTEKIMDTITTKEYYSVRGKINGKEQFIDLDGYQYDYPSPLHCCFSEREAEQALDNISYNYPDNKFEIVKVTEQYKITKQ